MLGVYLFWLYDLSDPAHVWSIFFRTIPKLLSWITEKAELFQEYKPEYKLRIVSFQKVISQQEDFTGEMTKFHHETICNLGSH